MLPSLRSPRSIRALVCLVVGLAGVGSAACETDHVLPGDYGPLDDGGAPSPGRGDARATTDGGEPTPTGDATVRQGDAGTPSSSRCDMSGRWLVAQRVLADAIGQKQASHNWFYYEIAQFGDQVVVTRGLHCGFEVVPITSLAATVDSQPVWPSILVHDSDTGRQGTMSVTFFGLSPSPSRSGTPCGEPRCPFLQRPDAKPMPTTSQQASGSTPGWE